MHGKENAAEFSGAPITSSSTTSSGTSQEKQKKGNDKTRNTDKLYEGGDLPPLHGRGNAAQFFDRHFTPLSTSSRTSSGNLREFGERAQREKEAFDKKMSSILGKLGPRAQSSRTTTTTPTARPLSDRLHGAAHGDVEEVVGSSVLSSTMGMDALFGKTGTQWRKTRLTRRIIPRS